ncbi:MAG: SpoVK/Ycf46/Vps4 family AAA+-type ATPase [Phenylobacterium sp.]|jgi:SpoVK/Ycf46/Vps4 family AAA+-type ATPase
MNMMQLTPIDRTGDSGTPSNPGQANADSLAQEIHWFGEVLDLRVKLYFEQGPQLTDIRQLPPPDLTAHDSPYAALVRLHGLNFDERVALTLAVIPHVKPQALDIFFSRNGNFDRIYTEFGGVRDNRHSGFLPTCETLAFVLAGDDLAKRFEINKLFDDQHIFALKGILTLTHQSQNQPFFSGALQISAEYLNKFTTALCEKIDYSSRFPAKLITTKLSWQDLVLAPEVMDEIDKINTWIKHSGQIMQKWGLEKSLKPGYRSLFYGPPGTGKTLTATLIGAELGRDVYRIDLSSMVSKYIGETEKNLANLFDQAQNKSWILFFDEADALFGTRSGGSSANDRHANQQIAYLLQRIEDFPGTVILATNLRANIDPAFSRRFQSLVYFPMPDAEQRLQLWQKILNGEVENNVEGNGKNRQLADEQVLADIAEQYELAGGAITNVVRYAAICAIQADSETISYQDLRKGIGKELRKEGRTL